MECVDMEMVKMHTQEVKDKLIEMVNSEIEELKCTIENEELWELGYNGEEPNPHTGNIKRLRVEITELYSIITAIINC